MEAVEDDSRGRGSSRDEGTSRRAGRDAGESGCDAHARALIDDGVDVAERTERSRRTRRIGAARCGGRRRDERRRFGGDSGRAGEGERRGDEGGDARGVDVDDVAGEETSEDERNDVSRWNRELKDYDDDDAAIPLPTTTRDPTAR